jgi:hypothetical protein
MTATGTPEAQRTLLVTGAAGFIGSAVVRHLLDQHAAPRGELRRPDLRGQPRQPPRRRARRPPRVRPRRRERRRRARPHASHYEPDAVLHLAAESHVDRSIDGPAAFIRSNVQGTFTLLEAVRRFLATRTAFERERFRFVHVSTDEVFGSLGAEGAFDTRTPYDPRSPVQRQQGRLGPPRAGLAPHLRPARGRHELQQQLRALPVPREADPARAPAGHPRPAAAGLRRRQQRARLALRRRPRPRPGDGGAARHAGRHLPLRRQQRSAPTSRWSSAVRGARRAAPARCPARAPDHLRARPAGARLPLRHRRVERPRRPRLDARAHVRRRHRHHGRLVPRHLDWCERRLGSGYGLERLGVGRETRGRDGA